MNLHNGNSPTIGISIFHILLVKLVTGLTYSGICKILHNSLLQLKGGNLYDCNV